MTFAAAPEYQVFPQGPEPLNFYEAVVQASRDTIPLVRDLKPDLAVADILTLRTGPGGRERGRPLGDTDSPRLSRWRARLPDLLDREGRVPTHGGLGRSIWRLCPADHRKGPRAGSEPSSTKREGRAGPGAARPRPRGDQQATGHWWAPSRSSSIRASGPSTFTSWDPLMWEPPTEDVELPGSGG